MNWYAASRPVVDPNRMAATLLPLKPKGYSRSPLGRAILSGDVVNPTMI
jgi:hypothetical protein